MQRSPLAFPEHRLAAPLHDVPDPDPGLSEEEVVLPRRVYRLVAPSPSRRGLPLVLLALVVATQLAGGALFVAAAALAAAWWSWVS